MNDLKQLQDQIAKLQSDLQSLSSEYHNGNFSGSQDFNKYASFNARLKVPVFTADPATGVVGEIICVGGKLKVCSAANVFTIVGTQS